MHYLKKSSIFFLVAYIVWQLCLTLFDISTRAIDPKANPDYQRQQYAHRQPVYLVSYAAGNEVFFQNQHALVQSALNRGIDFFLNYRPSHIDPTFYEKHKAILNEKMGAGYWLWKPYVILKTLKEIPENSIIIYADTGAIFTNSLIPLLEKLNTHDGIVYAYEPSIYGNLQDAIDSKVALETKTVNRQDFNAAPQLWAGFMILKNTPKVRQFVEEWLNLCTNPNWLKGYGGHRHMHDQALFSLCYFKNPGKILSLHENEFRPFLKWQHRHQDEQRYSLMVYQQPSMHYVEHKAWRFPPLKWLRYVLLPGRH